MHITFIQTGGTIDKDYTRRIEGYNFEIGKPVFIRILKNVNPDFEYDVIRLLSKDSLDLTEEDREKILEECKRVKSKKIIITHGTDTIIKTAKIIGRDIEDKLIILTGALRPGKMKESDAEFNLGLAVGAANVLEKGVYVAVNGGVHHWKDVHRDRKTGKFMSNLREK